MVTAGAVSRRDSTVTARTVRHAMIGAQRIAVSVSLWLEELAVAVVAVRQTLVVAVTISLQRLVTTFVFRCSTRETSVMPNLSDCNNFFRFVDTFPT